MRITKHIPMAVCRLFVAGLLLFAAGCAREDGSFEGAIPEGYGLLDLGSVTRSVVATRAAEAIAEQPAPATRASEAEAAETEPATRAADINDFTVRVWRIRTSGETLAGSWKMSECSGKTVPLAVGTYRMEINSGEQQPATFETPWYEGKTEPFAIVEGETTDIGNVECRLGNIKVTVRYGKSLLDVLESATVTVSVDGNALEFPYGEQRGGYFSAAEPAEMTVTFTGVVDTALTTFSETRSVAPGEWERIRFVLEGDSSFPVMVFDNEAGQIGDGEDWFY